MHSCLKQLNKICFQNIRLNWESFHQFQADRSVCHITFRIYAESKVRWWTAKSLMYTNTSVENDDSETWLKHTHFSHATYLGLKNPKNIEKPQHAPCEANNFQKGGNKEAKGIIALKSNHNLFQPTILPSTIFFFFLSACPAKFQHSCCSSMFSPARLPPFSLKCSSVFSGTYLTDWKQK